MKLKPATDQRPGRSIVGSKAAKNYVAANKRTAQNIPRSATIAFDNERRDRLNNSVYVAPQKTIGKNLNREFGKVPAYLEERKQERAAQLAREEQQRLEE